LKQKCGVQAAQFLLGQRYIEAYGKLANKDNTIILPSDPIQVKSNVNDSMSFF